MPVPSISHPDVRAFFNLPGVIRQLMSLRFVPADAFWNLAMAINVYLTLFKKYNAQQLKAVEWKYHLACYGLPFAMALPLLFVETQAKGKVYGPAVVCFSATRTVRTQKLTR